MWRLAPILLMLALAVVGAALIPAQIDRLKDIRLEQTRTQLPGSRSVELDARKYVVWIETRGGGLTRTDPSPNDVAIQIRPAVGGASLALRDYGDSFTTDSGGREGAAFATVTPPSHGNYVIGGDAGAMVAQTTDPSVALGLPTRGAVLRLVLGIALVAIGIVGMIVAIILAIVLPRPEKDKPQSPVAGGDPFNAG